MLKRETDPDGGGLPPFWTEAKEKGQAVFVNSVTNSSQRARPKNVVGVRSLYYLFFPLDVLTGFPPPRGSF